MSPLSMTPPGEPRRPGSTPDSPTATSHAGDGAEIALVLSAAPEARAVQAALFKAVKRSFDVVASATLLLVLLPVLVTIAVLVRIDSPGHAFFRCDRVGYRGRRFGMLKFRKMVAGARGAPLTTVGDERFTRLGRWLTRYKLDELPQIWQVFKGEMSLVGPRPESDEFVQRHADDYYDHILTVRPGVFGLSQIAFAGENGILDRDDPVGHYVARILPQKVALDRMYAARHNPWLDARILFWSCVTVVLRRPVAVDRRSGAMKVRRRKRRS